MAPGDPHAPIYPNVEPDGMMGNYKYLFEKGWVRVRGTSGSSVMLQSYDTNITTMAETLNKFIDAQQRFAGDREIEISLSIVKPDPYLTEGGYSEERGIRMMYGDFLGEELQAGQQAQQRLLTLSLSLRSIHQLIFNVQESRRTEVEDLWLTAMFGVGTVYLAASRARNSGSDRPRSANETLLTGNKVLLAADRAFRARVCRAAFGPFPRAAGTALFWGIVSG
jgi:hypothetical protein